MWCVLIWLLGVFFFSLCECVCVCALENQTLDFTNVK